MNYTFFGLGVISLGSKIDLLRSFSCETVLHRSEVLEDEPSLGARICYACYQDKPAA